MLYSVLSAITEVDHLCQKVIIVLLHLEVEKRRKLRRQLLLSHVENSLHPSDVRLGPSEPHGKRQPPLALLASVKQRFGLLLASQKA